MKALIMKTNKFCLGQGCIKRNGSGSGRRRIQGKTICFTSRQWRHN
jgi:hypothetical protein